MHELTTEDQSSFKNFLRVDPDIFMELLHHVGPRIEKQDTFFRKALPPGLKLAVTLRYLATGGSYKSLSYSFRIVHVLMLSIQAVHGLPRLRSLHYSVTHVTL